MKCSPRESINQPAAIPARPRRGNRPLLYDARATRVYPDGSPIGQR